MYILKITTLLQFRKKLLCLISFKAFYKNSSLWIPLPLLPQLRGLAKEKYFVLQYFWRDKSSYFHKSDKIIK